MGRGLQSSALVVALWLACAPSHAADTPPPVKDWSKDIETVVVTAHRSGPLMWKVKRGDATVVLFGILEPVPEKLAAGTARRCATRSKARGELLLPPEASVGIVEGAVVPRLELGQGLSAVGHADGIDIAGRVARARFAAGREKIHRDADRYARPARAARGAALRRRFLQGARPHL